MVVTAVVVVGRPEVVPEVGLEVVPEVVVVVGAIACITRLLSRRVSSSIETVYTYPTVRATTSNR